MCGVDRMHIYISNLYVLLAVGYVKVHVCVSSLPTEYYDQNIKYELEQETLQNVKNEFLYHLDVVHIQYL